MRKVLTIGDTPVEIVATTKDDGFRAAQPMVGPFPSAAPAIFIDQLGKLGTPCAIVSRVGDDDFGQVNIDRLRTDGVDVSGIAIARRVHAPAAPLSVIAKMAAAPSSITSATAPAAICNRPRHPRR